jgi:hypothetical protein
MNTDGLGSLGFYSLSILYLFAIIGGLFSAAILNKLNIYKCFFIGGVGITLWSLSSIFAAIKTEYTQVTSFITSKVILYLYHI